MVRRGRETFITSTMRMKGHGHRKYAWWVTEWRAWLCSSFCPLSWRCRSVSLIVCFWGARFRVQSLRVGLMYIIPTFLAHARNPRPHTQKCQTVNSCALVHSLSVSGVRWLFASGIGSLMHTVSWASFVGSTSKVSKGFNSRSTWSL